MVARRAPGRSARGFTLIEMLVVIAIVTMLAGLLIGGVMVARRKANEGAVKSFLQALDQAIVNYETVFGDYPPGAGDVDSAESLYECLTSAKRGNTPMEFKDSQWVDTDRDGRPEVCDHWRTPLRYSHWREYEGPPREHSFRITSAGPDAVHEDGEGDDIVNWK